MYTLVHCSPSNLLINVSKLHTETVELSEYGFFPNYQIPGFELMTLGQLSKCSHTPIHDLTDAYYSWLSLFADIFMQYPTLPRVEFHFVNTMENYPVSLIAFPNGTIEIYEDEPMNLQYYTVIDDTNNFVFDINKYIKLYKSIDTIHQVKLWKFDVMKHTIDDLSDMFSKLNIQ